MTDHIGEDYRRLKEQAAEYNRTAHRVTEFVQLESWDEVATAILNGYSVGEAPRSRIWVPGYDNGNVIDAVKVVDRTHEDPEPKRLTND